MTKVCLIGIGRTGGEIARVLLDQEDIRLEAAFCRSDSDRAGLDIGEIISAPLTGTMVYPIEDLAKVIEEVKPDVVVDFSSPAATLSNTKILGERGVNMVIGTTGFTDMDMSRLMVLARKYNHGIVYAPNITMGVNVMMLLSNIAASILSDYDFQITEVHHKHKKDVPSGTARKLATAVEKGLGDHGEIRSVPINAVRAGGVVGNHHLTVAGEYDKIEIVHEAFSRKAFAAGAIKAINFVKGKHGFYEMSDVLELEKVLGKYVRNKRQIQEQREKAFSVYREEVIL